MKSIPKISKYMTTTPNAINSDSSVYEAMEMMEKHKIRHLPVIKDKKVFGIMSDRNVKSLFTFAGVNPKNIKVGDVCTDLPYITEPDAPLSQVATDMAIQKLGSALVLDNGKLVGIFTATDACEALSDICQQRFHN